MPELFEKTAIGSMTLANRFVRSATWEGLADAQGDPEPRLAALMGELARGEVGLIVSGHAFVSPEGRASLRQLSCADASRLAGLAGLARAAHDAGGVIALQLAHAGCQAPRAITGLEPVGPSVLEKDGQPLCREATREDIQALIQAFGRAAGLAKRAGFDAVQLHCAHGYLLSQFLSPFCNKRRDAYGGSLENRARLPLEAVAAVREAVGPGYPVLVKMNSEDFLEPGLTREEAVAVAALFQAATVHAVEFSGGTGFSPARRVPVRPGRLKGPEDEAYYREAARMYKKTVGIPLVLTGGIRSLEVAQALVAEGTADFVGLSRPLIREPGLVKRWRQGDQRPSGCVNDNACFRPALAGDGISCATLAAEKAKKG